MREGLSSGPVGELSQAERDRQSEMSIAREFTEAFSRPDGGPVTAGHQITDFEPIEQELDQGEPNNG